MNPTVLFRASDLGQEQELEIAQMYLPVVRYRNHVPEDSLVVPRYSVLPFYRELEIDLETRGCKLLNSYREHHWIADFDYYHYFKDVTPRTWWERELPQCEHPGPFVVKGCTNSRKHRWKTHMYAETRKDALRIASELANDAVIGGSQDIIYREYIPLKTFERCSISGLPYTNEYRFFFYKEQMLTHGYYWSVAENPEQYQVSEKGMQFARDLALRAAKHCTFFVLDIAERADVEDEWILIEINDGQMSGLSMCDPHQLYSGLKTALTH